MLPVVINPLVVAFGAPGVKVIESACHASRFCSLKIQTETCYQRERERERGRCTTKKSVKLSQPTLYKPEKSDMRNQSNASFVHLTPFGDQTSHHR